MMKSLFQREILSTPETEISAVFAHNQKLLTTEVQSAVKGAAVFGMRIEDKRCFAKPMNLYVERPNGKILAATSIEKERREQAYDHGKFLVSKAIPNLIHAVQEDSERPVVFGNIAKVPVWYLIAYPVLDKSKQVIKDKILVDRPESWTRNDQIVMGDELTELSIEALLPDTLDRAVFLKSLENYNSVSEPNYVDA